MMSRCSDANLRISRCATRLQRKTYNQRTKNTDVERIFPRAYARGTRAPALARSLRSRARSLRSRAAMRDEVLAPVWHPKGGTFRSPLGLPPSSMRQDVLGVSSQSPSLTRGASCLLRAVETPALRRQGDASGLRSRVITSSGHSLAALARAISRSSRSSRWAEGSFGGVLAAARF